MMLNRWMRGTVCLLALVALAGCGSNAQTRTTTNVLNTEPVAIHQRIAGSDEAFKQTGVQLINDTQALESLGSAALSQLQVDFSHQSVLLLTIGQVPTLGYWIHLDAVQRNGNLIHVQGTANRPAEDATVPPTIQYPFEAAVIDKVVGQIVPDIRSVAGEGHPDDAAQ